MKLASRLLPLISLAFALVVSGCGGSDTVAPAPKSTKPTFAGMKRSVPLATGIEMKYLEAGAVDGDVVLFLHGYTDTSRSFVPTIESLVERDTKLHLYAIDQRGHGETSMPPENECAETPGSCFEVEDFAADALAFMDALGIERASVVGHSMGSMVAQEVALEQPERVENLALIGTFVRGAGNPVIEDFLLGGAIEGEWKSRLEASRPGFRWPRDAYLLTPKEADPDVERWMIENWVVEPSADPAFLQEILPETSATRLGTWLGVLEGLRVVDNRERLQELTMPVLVLWATQDVVVPEDPNQVGVRAALDAAVQQCRTRYVFKTYGKRPIPESGLLDDLGHNTQWGAPAMVAADLEAFLATGRPTPDLVYADPNNVRHLLVEPGGAPLRTGEPPEGCAPSGNRGSSPLSQKRIPTPTVSLKFERQNESSTIASRFWVKAGPG